MISKQKIKSFCLLVAILLLFPYLFALNASFRGLGEFSDNMFGFSKLTLENYKRVFNDFVYQVVLADGSAGAYDFWGLTGNSFAYAIGGALCAAMSPCITAYCCSKFDFLIGKILTNIVYITMAIPIIGTTAASIQMTKMIGINDTLPGVWFLKCGFLGMNFLLYFGNFNSIPSDYTESAKIDGAGNFTIFFKIMFPMVKNLFSLQVILNFVSLWSDYGVPMYYLPSKPTLSLALLNFTNLSATSITMQLAGCILLCLPTLTLFIAFKDSFMGNVQMGGIKG